ncbi:MAG: hypothetical protein M1833_006221 [Piccolia ochrophora]|nr:MAG: hypothetical protein M1833_006221 [Piccolia ochrophora]
MATLSEENREHFDTIATTCENQGWQHVMDRIREETRKHKAWLGVNFVNEGEEGEGKRVVKVLDYACGPGTMAATIEPWATEVRGVDVAPKMVEQFNARAKCRRDADPEMFAVVGDISPAEGPSASIAGEDYHGFDLAVVGVALHHMHDSKLVLRRLAERVKVGTGVVFIVDVVPHAHHHTSAEHTVAHHGFSKEQMVDLMKGAGCRDVKYKVVCTSEVSGKEGKAMEMTVFFCRGTRER